MRREAKLAGVDLLYHTHRSDRSDAGYPDEVWAFRGTKRQLILEFKRQSQDAVLTTSQAAWLDWMAAFRDGGNSGVEVYGPVRPMDRDALVVTLYEGKDAPGALHQWCVSEDCRQCAPERRRATPSRQRQRGRARR
jgi:hypothetical protein